MSDLLKDRTGFCTGPSIVVGVHLSIKLDAAKTLQVLALLMVAIGVVAEVLCDLPIRCEAALNCAGA